jgi:hypothetical protein
VEDSEVDIAFTPGGRDGQDIKCRVSRVAMPDYLTSGTPSLLSSFRNTLRSIAIKIASTDRSIVSVV